MRLHPHSRRSQAGFTLLELLVVIAIVATLGGAALFAYDGLDQRGSKAQATFNLAAIDRAVRTYKVVNGSFPNELDAAVLDNTTGVTNTTALSSVTGGGFFAGLHSNMEGTDGDVTTGDGKFAFIELTAEMVSALSDVGITTVRQIDNTLGNSSTTIPLRSFDDATRGKGVVTTLATGTVLPIIEAKNFAASDSSRLRDITGLDAGVGHVVVALGLGNNSSIVSDDINANAANLSEAPFYTDVAKDEYGRFFLLFHLASDADDDGSISTSEVFSSARFIGVVDSKGDWLDEEYAEATGQKI